MNGHCYRLGSCGQQAILVDFSRRLARGDLDGLGTFEDAP